MIAAARATWENELGPLLSMAQVRELLGGVSRQRVQEQLRARRLIGLRESSGRWSYPLFQFADGQPIELLVTVFWMVVDGGLEGWSAASWCVTPEPALGGSSALEWCRRGDDAESNPRRFAAGTARTVAKCESPSIRTSTRTFERSALYAPTSSARESIRSGAWATSPREAASRRSASI